MSIITDHHVHSEFSGDCNTPMEDIIERALNLGLKEVIFTDHMDFDYPSDEITFQVDYKQYMKKINKLREEYKEMDILMGIEIGYQSHLNSRLNELLDSYPFDFVICSIHALNGLELDKGDLFKGKTQHEGYMTYLESLKSCVESYDNCDVYGHLDFIIRYGNFENRVLTYKDYKEILDEILCLIISKGKGIEVNTSGLRYNLGAAHPNRDILKRYLQLGGEIITLGSDAHKTEDLCANFHQVIKELKKIGFTKITKFKNRKPTFINI